MRSSGAIWLIVMVASATIAAVRAIHRWGWGPQALVRKRLVAGSAVIADRDIVTLTGTVRAIGELLEAPLSGTRCVLYLASGRVLRGTRVGQEVIAEAIEHKLVAFELVQADGTIVHVEGERADIDMPRDPLVPRKLEREREFFAAHGLAPDAIRTAGFEEVAIAPGARIRVQGMAIVERDAAAEAGYRDDGPRKIRLVAPLTIGTE